MKNTPWQQRIERLGLDQKDLARLLGVSENTISRQLGDPAKMMPHTAQFIRAWEMMPQASRDRLWETAGVKDCETAPSYRLFHASSVHLSQDVVPAGQLLIPAYPDRFEVPAAGTSMAAPTVAGLVALLLHKLEENAEVDTSDLVSTIDTAIEQVETKTGVVELMALRSEVDFTPTAAAHERNRDLVPRIVASVAHLAAGRSRTGAPALKNA